MPGGASFYRVVVGRTAAFTATAGFFCATLQRLIAYQIFFTGGETPPSLITAYRVTVFIIRALEVID